MGMVSEGEIASFLALIEGGFSIHIALFCTKISRRF